MDAFCKEMFLISLIVSKGIWVLPPSSYALILVANARIDALEFSWDYILFSLKTQYLPRFGKNIFEEILFLSLKNGR